MLVVVEIQLNFIFISREVHIVHFTHHRFQCEGIAVKGFLSKVGLNLYGRLTLRLGIITFIFFLMK